MAGDDLTEAVDNAHEGFVKVAPADTDAAFEEPAAGAVSDEPRFGG